MDRLRVCRNRLGRMAFSAVPACPRPAPHAHRLCGFLLVRTGHAFCPAAILAFCLAHRFHSAPGSHIARADRFPRFAARNGASSFLIAPASPALLHGSAGGRGDLAGRPCHRCQRRIRCRAVSHRGRQVVKALSHRAGPRKSAYAPWLFQHDHAALGGDGSGRVVRQRQSPGQWLLSHGGWCS